MDFLNASTIQSDFYLKCHINHCGHFSWSKLSVKWWYPSLMVSSLIIEVLLIEVSHQGNKWWISPEGGNSNFWQLNATDGVPWLECHQNSFFPFIMIMMIGAKLNATNAMEFLDNQTWMSSKFLILALSRSKLLQIIIFHTIVGIL